MSDINETEFRDIRQLRSAAPSEPAPLTISEVEGVVLWSESAAPARTCAACPKPETCLEWDRCRHGYMGYPAASPPETTLDPLSREERRSLPRKLTKDFSRPPSETAAVQEPAPEDLACLKPQTPTTGANAIFGKLAHIPWPEEPGSVSDRGEGTLTPEEVQIASDLALDYRVNGLVHTASVLERMIASHAALAAQVEKSDSEWDELHARYVAVETERDLLRSERARTQADVTQLENWLCTVRDHLNIGDDELRASSVEVLDEYLAARFARSAAARSAVHEEPT